MRFIEIDILRGIALILMVFYHAVFDYNFFIQSVSGFPNGPWFIMARTAAVLFVGLTGLSMVLSAHRSNRSIGEQRRFFLMRGFFLLGIGLVITFLSWLFFPAYTIWFGILHFLGVATILSIPIIYRPRLAAIAGTVFVFFGVFLSVFVAPENLPFLPPFFPVTFQTFDYFPLLPWLGVFWLGIAISHLVYPNGESLFLKKISLLLKENRILNGLALFGRGTLLVYLLHQPIIIGILLLAKSIGIFQ